MTRQPPLSILLTAVLTAGFACSQEDSGSPATTGGASTASCSSECLDYYDCRFSLCLLQGGSTCSTDRIEGREACDRLRESDCTGSLLSMYDSCEASEESGEDSMSTGSSTGGSSGWADSSSTTGSSDWGGSTYGDSSSTTGSLCLPPNSFCLYDYECCSEVCDFDFEFCH